MQTCRQHTHTQAAHLTQTEPVGTSKVHQPKLKPQGLQVAHPLTFDLMARSLYILLYTYIFY